MRENYLSAGFPFSLSFWQPCRMFVAFVPVRLGSLFCLFVRVGLFAEKNHEKQVDFSEKFGIICLNMLKGGGEVKRTHLFFVLVLMISVILCASVTYAEAEEWTCTVCGTVGTGNFCRICGSAKPAPDVSEQEWICPQCGTAVTGNFCHNCGAARDGTVKRG
ncbi:MAG TPA: hypothetical protein DHV42_07870, partial [Lachnospiraceae bacterium]|nr:hypothetical protein [Lachnospiraceae bacterium]